MPWRRVFRSMRLIVFAYVGVVLVLMLLENWLVYHPAGAERDWQEAPSNEIEDVQLTTANGATVHGWWCPCPGASSALLYFHGNAGNLSWRGSSILKIRKHLGVNVLIIDYPGYGKSTGRPSEVGCYQAADAALAWLTNDKGYASRDVLLWGASLGGGVAVDLASRNECGGLILIKTFTALPDVGSRLYPWLPVRWVMRNRFSNIDKIAQCKCPVFITHGTTDEVVPYSLGERLFEAAPAPKEFFRMPGVGHNDPLSEEMFDALKEFLKKTSKANVGA